jgi:hypothetical protein
MLDNPCMGKAQVSEIDRLIELASDEKPRQAVVTEMPLHSNRSLSLQDKEDQKDPKPSMWRVLLQLRVLLPYLALVLPLLERGILGTNVLSGPAPAQHRLDTTHFDEGLAGLEDAHKDLTVQLKNQSSEIKFLQEQIGWLGKSIENHALRQEEIAHSIASLRKMVLISALIGLVLLASLIAIEMLRLPFLR